ncbi:hypothetical protein ABSA28_01105 [Candidatus Hepatincolaceae symbiont of Richtersius coronifer]
MQNNEHHNKPFFLKVSLLLGLILLAGCSSSQSFNVNKKTLDPFTIYTYPPLALPPIYYLSSKDLADERRFLRLNQEKVQNLLGYKVPAKSKASANLNVLSEADKRFLQLANADKDLSFIKDKVDEETLGIIKKEQSFINKIFAGYKGEALDAKLTEYVKYNKK